MGRSTKRADGSKKQPQPLQTGQPQPESEPQPKAPPQKYDGGSIYDDEESLEYFDRFIAGDR
jgi:hypothetical protein